MGLFDAFRTTDSAAALQEENRQLSDTLELFEERMADLEFALEDVGWLRLSMEGDREFSREGLKRIIALSRLSYLKSPLINRGVEVQKLYVFGQGVTIGSADEDVAEVVKAFLKRNKSEFSHQNLGLKEVELQATGNLFFALFANSATGDVKVRMVPVEEIEDVIRNPGDAGEPWFYKRRWSSPIAGTSEQSALYSDLGFRSEGQQVALYPDWEYQPTAKPDTYGGTRVEWDTPICHVKVGGFANMRFGIPETYSALDWARAYKEFLENWFTIVKAYSRFAMRLTVPGGKTGIAAAKAKLGTGVSASSPVESNPAPLTGSMFAGGPDSKLEPIRTAGAQTKAEDGRRGLLMVAAAMGLPETFFGDSSVGNLATAKTLDRPTELKFVDRRTLWGDILEGLLRYQIVKSAAAPSGALLTGTDPEEAVIDIDWPPILEHDVDAAVKAIVSAVTLDGKQPQLMDDKVITKLVLSALGVDDIDQLLDDWFPEGWEKDQKRKDARQTPQPTDETTPAQESTFLEAVKTLREAVADLAGE